jgi:AraC-like DNA-binding protein
VSSHQPHVGNGVSARSDGKKKEEAVEIWRPADFNSIELHSGAASTIDYPRHWHDELYVCAIVDGVNHLDCAGTSYFTPPGTLVLIPSGEIHANGKRDCAFRCVFMDVKMLQTAVEQFVERAISGMNFRTKLVTDEKTVTSFLRMHRSLQISQSKLRRDTFVLRFLHRLVSRHSAASIAVSRGGNEDFAVQRTKRFLDEHYAERVSLSDLARLTGLSAYHLHRSFCRKIGMPPHAYQVHVRITRARSFLRRGRSISDAAFSTGFVDQSHFSRHFKRLTGVTPGRFVHPKQEHTRRSASHALASLA